MRPPLSKRLAACAALVPRGAVAADVGTDHGYLSIYLVQQGICPRVIASDLRQKPLEKARENVLRYGASEQITLLLSDGLKNFLPGSFDTLICAGMGGDCICAILQAAPWLKDGRYTLILQPQSSGNDLRRWLGQNGFSIERETLVLDGRFLYGVMAVRYGAGRELTPGGAVCLRRPFAFRRRESAPVSGACPAGACPGGLGHPKRRKRGRPGKAGIL